MQGLAPTGRVDCLAEAGEEPSVDRDRHGVRVGVLQQRGRELLRQGARCQVGVRQLNRSDDAASLALGETSLESLGDDRAPLRVVELDLQQLHGAVGLTDQPVGLQLADLRPVLLVREALEHRDVRGVQRRGAVDTAHVHRGDPRVGRLLQGAADGAAVLADSDDDVRLRGDALTDAASPAVRVELAVADARFPPDLLGCVDRAGGGCRAGRGELTARDDPCGDVARYGECRGGVGSSPDGPRGTGRDDEGDRQCEERADERPTSAGM